MMITHRTALRRGLVAGVFAAGLAAAGPAGLAFADDIDVYGMTSENTLSVFFGTQDYTWTDSVPFQALVTVDQTTGQSVPTFTLPTVVENTTTLPGGEQGLGYADQSSSTVYWGDLLSSPSGDLATTTTNNSEIAYFTAPGGESEFVFDPFSSESATGPMAPPEAPPA